MSIQRIDVATADDPEDVLVWCHHLFEVGPPIRNQATRIEDEEEAEIKAFNRAKDLYKAGMKRVKQRRKDLEKDIRKTWSEEEIKQAKQTAKDS